MVNAKFYLVCMLAKTGQSFWFKQPAETFRCRLHLKLTEEGNQERVLDDPLDVVDVRKSELMKRQRRGKICKSMPRSQKWFKAKQQHISPNQKRIFNEHWPTYGINLKYGSELVPYKEFSSTPLSSASTSVVLDIGFGTGDSIIAMSQKNKDKIYLGCEIHRAGISTALGNISSLGIENIRLIKADVTLLLEVYLTDRCLDEVCIFFPDPWPNMERDGERRVVRKDIIALLSERMKSGGLLRIATDAPDYADHVLEVMDAASGWKLSKLMIHLPCIDGPSYRPVTRYERKAIELSNKIWDFEYVFSQLST